MFSFVQPTSRNPSSKAAPRMAEPVNDKYAGKAGKYGGHIGRSGPSPAVESNGGLPIRREDSKKARRAAK